MSLRTWMVTALLAGGLALCVGAPVWSQSVSESECCPLLCQAGSENDSSSMSDISSNWSSVVHPGFFHCKMPGTPIQDSTMHGKVETLKWSSDSSEPMHLFEVSMSQFARGAIDPNELDGFLFAVMNSRAKELGSSPTRKRRINDPRLPGCMFRVDSPDSSTEWDFMVRVEGSTVYTLSVCSNPGEGDDGYSSTFFKSFDANR